ncbi:hypothetical protein SapgrDRAFT_0222 [Saprospira grandis DSM 2844]|uniref:Uncharacterized protein n=1 Tax=Saprospira grandis DSM 2844 TaxID=694433 RepID=J1HZZ4_9BACT|nr:hypothetical protein SapgrDRAFT_0222 [Saprospira grandis DSM 2844]
MSSPICIDLPLGPPAFGGRLLPLVVELRTKVLVVVYFVELAPLRGWLSGLAARSALRGLRPLGLAFGHPCTSLGQSLRSF